VKRDGWKTQRLAGLTRPRGALAADDDDDDDDDDDGVRVSRGRGVPSRHARSARACA
jgi:hypothetical protein